VFRKNCDCSKLRGKSRIDERVPWKNRRGMDIATEGPTERKTCIVVDEQDEVKHIGGLAECHTRPCVLHRAFSLFVFDEQNRLLLQQRAKTKYTFPLAWTNTVCSHPRNLEKELPEWIDIRVQDELGWEIKDVQSRLVPFGKLTYEAFSDFKYGEKEIDTLYLLEVTEDEKAGISLNRDEVETIDWVEPCRLEKMMSDDHILLTPWFRAIASNMGHPFRESIARVLSNGKAAEDDESKEDPVPSAVAPSMWIVHPDTGLRLPWFRVGNCSIPKANPDSDLLLQAPFSYLCSNPGKALRSELVKLYAELDGDVSAEDAEGACGIVERIHNASLLHDDIEDRSSTRRGAACAHHLWGTAQTINTGTFNFLRAIESVDTLLGHRSEAARSAIMRYTTSMLLNLHRGQNADICWGEHALCPSAADYLEMIDNKTGALFQACALIPSLCSGNKSQGSEIAEQFVDLGRYFQIRDDLCNICDPKYWEAKGFYEDADEGKYSYPVLLFFEKALTDDKFKQDAAWLRAALAKKDEQISIQDKLRAYAILHDANALHETHSYCQSKLEGLRSGLAPESKRAQAILKLIPLVDILEMSVVADLVQKLKH